MYSIFFQILCTLACSIGTTSSFVLATQCAAPPPCTCSLATIHCENKRISQVPAFTINIGHLYTFIVHLDFNHLTVIPAYAFKNLSAVNVTSINIHLNNNRISKVDTRAFNGIEHALTFLNLNNNNLSHLPVALTGLPSLLHLYLMANPFVNIDASVLANLSNIINVFKISTGRSTSLPNELGFKNSLKNLEMSYSDFATIPSVVCRLKYLRSFTVNYSPNLSRYNGSIFDACNQTMSTVSVLSLQYDQLTTVPKFALVFPSMESLFLGSNALHKIESNSFVGLTSLTELDLHSNNLTRVPFAINKAINLRKLYVNNNKIDTIQDLDLSSLQKLTFLDLYGNPLVHVSTLAFAHNPLLNEIDLGFTSIVGVPRALLRLAHLRNVYLRDKPINCSCQAMNYLTSWNVTSVSIDGSCNSGNSLKNYLTTDLPKCP